MAEDEGIEISDRDFTGLRDLSSGRRADDHTLPPNNNNNAGDPGFFT
jgi:hypothetical protein